MVQGLMLGRQLLSSFQMNVAEQSLTSMSIEHKGKVWNCAYSIAYLNRDIVILLEFYFLKTIWGLLEIGFLNYEKKQGILLIR